MKRNHTLTSTAFTIAVLVWSFACHADPPTAKTSKGPDGSVGTNSSRDNPATKHPPARQRQGQWRLLLSNDFMKIYQ